MAFTDAPYVNVRKVSRMSIDLTVVRFIYCFFVGVLEIILLKSGILSLAFRHCKSVVIEII